MADFEITGCHANRAGQASVTLKDKATGAVVSIHHMPFQHDYGESVRDECGRINAEAVRFAREAIGFLQTCPHDAEVVHPTPGAAPVHTEPPDAFGQPLEPEKAG